MTFDAFKEQFLAHIDGTANNDREAVESQDENENGQNKSAKPGTLSKRGTDMNDVNKTSSSRMLNETGSIDDDGPKSRLSRRSDKKSESMRQSRLGNEDATTKFEIPESCYLTMMKKILIEKLENKFFLAVNPFPRIEGEMIIFKPQKEDQTRGKDVLVYRDFSLRKRIETTPLAIKEAILSQKKQQKLVNKGKEDKEEKKENVPDALLPCLEVDITEPLSKSEWANWLKVIDETQGLGWFQILPVGQKSSQPYQFNLLHVLGQDKIPVERLPLDAFIAN